MLTWAFFRCIDAALLDGFEVGPSSLAHPLFWGSVGLGLAGQVWLHIWSDGSGKSRGKPRMRFGFGSKGQAV